MDEFTKTVVKWLRKEQNNHNVCPATINKIAKMIGWKNIYEYDIETLFNPSDGYKIIKKNKNRRISIATRLISRFLRQIGKNKSTKAKIEIFLNKFESILKVINDGNIDINDEQLLNITFNNSQVADLPAPIIVKNENHTSQRPSNICVDDSSIVDQILNAPILAISENENNAEYKKLKDENITPSNSQIVDTQDQAIVKSAFDVVQKSSNDNNNTYPNDQNKEVILLLNNVEVIFRQDGYLNATQLCKAGGKKFSHWCGLKNVKTLINVLISDAGIPASEIIQINKGKNNQDTFIHPKLGPHLAMWLSPEFALNVSDVINELLLTGDVKYSKNNMPKLEIKNLDEWKLKFEALQIQSAEDKFEAIIKERTEMIPHLLSNAQKYQRFIYLAYIGKHKTSEHNNELCYKFKFGKSYDLSTRNSTHVKKFPVWKLIHVIPCENLDQVEFMFKEKLRSLDKLSTCENETEITFISSDFSYHDLCNSLKDIVDLYPRINTTEQENAELKMQLKDQVKDVELLKLKNECIQKDAENEIKTLKFQLYCIKHNIPIFE